MRIGKAIRIIVVEPFEDSTEVSTDTKDQPIRDSRPQEVLLENTEVFTNERVPTADLLPV